MRSDEVRMKVVQLGPERVAEATDVLADAFYNYPVMRYVIGPVGGLYETRLRTLVEFFVTARFLRDDFVLAAEDDAGRSLAVATVTRPVERPASPEMSELRKGVWSELGADAYARYVALGEAWKEFDRDEPVYHLNMIGVWPGAAGTGLGRLLMGEVHARSKADAASVGVTLTTEDPSNVPLYEHFGYQVVGRVQVGPVQSWGFFRPDE
jgi:GNAT superfamily N-acetyltransferase